MSRVRVEKKRLLSIEEEEKAMKDEMGIERKEGVRNRRMRGRRDEGRGQRRRMTEPA